MSNTADIINSIKRTLGISITDLAELVGVSRQSIYLWLNGGDIKEEHLDRLEGLQALGEGWSQYVDKPMGKLLHFVADGRKSLFYHLKELKYENVEQKEDEILAAILLLIRKANENKQKINERYSKLNELDQNKQHENLLTHTITVE